MLSDYARMLMQLCVWREMRGVPDAWVATTFVICNRAVAEGYVQAVTKPWQFSSMTAHGDAELVKWPVDGEQVWLNLQATVNEVLAGKVPDPTGGATFYFSLPLTEPPAEWGPVQLTFEVGSVKFWKAV